VCRCCEKVWSKVISNDSLGFEPITQSDFLAPVLRVDRTLIVKPLDVTMQTTPSTPTVGRASQSSPTTPVEEQAPTVIPDSAERPDNTQVDTQMNESPKQVVDIVSPTPVKRKVRPQRNINHRSNPVHEQQQTLKSISLMTFSRNPHQRQHHKSNNPLENDPQVNPRTIHS
jgi:hypothetical protein